MSKLTVFHFEFNLKTRTKFGTGISVNLCRYLKELSFKKVGVIIDSGVVNQKYVKKILEGLHAERFDYLRTWVYNLNKEPDYDSLDRIKSKFLDENSKSNVDCFVGIGGGSV